MHRRQFGPVTAVAVALGFTAAAAALRLLVDRLLGDRLVLATMYGAVALAVWIAGWRTATAVAILGYLACDLLFIPPRGSVGLHDVASAAGFAIYALSCALIVLMGHRMREAERRSEARRAELEESGAALRESRDVLALAMRAGRMGAWSREMASNRVWWSRELEEIFGLGPGDFAGTEAGFFEFVHPEDRAAVAKAVEDALDRREDYIVEFRFRHADGSWRWMEGRGKAAYDGAGRAMMLYGLGIDITDRKQAEAAVAQSEAQLRFVTDNAPVSLAHCDPEGCYLFVNQQFLARFGVRRERVIGKTIHEFIGEDSYGAIEPYILAVLRGERVEFEIPIVYPAQGERWVRGVYLPERDPEGRVRGFLAMVQDVTARRTAEEALRRHRDELDRLVHERTVELERSHAALRLSERMAAMGTLAAGIGHDMGNMLVPMRLWLDVLESSELSPEGRATVASLRQSIEYLRNLASGLRLLSLNPEDNTGVPARTVLGDWWREVEGLYRAPLARGVALRAGDFSGVHPVGVPSHALTQAVFNIVQNAADAICESGKGGLVRVRAERAQDGRVKLSISDDGPGMTPEVMARCVEPFFTTKARGRGTGLGLSVVHNTLKRFGVDLLVDSTPGAGATFTLVLPPAGTSPVHGRTAVVTARDPRTEALVRAVAGGLGMDLRPSRDGTLPVTDVWIADESVEDARLETFLGRGGRVVSLAQRPAMDGRVQVVAQLRPAALRDAISRVLEPSDAPHA